MLSEDVKTDFSKATAALGERLRPAGRKALASAQLLSRKQKTGERVDTFVQVFEDLFEKSYGRQGGIDPSFKSTLKRDLFVQGLLLKWQEKVLPTAESFSEALHQARTAEEQERQLAEMHRRDSSCLTPRPGQHDTHPKSYPDAQDEQPSRKPPRGGGSKNKPAFRSWCWAFLSRLSSEKASSRG